MFIVEHDLEPDSYVTCRNEFGVAFTEAPVPNNSTMCRLSQEACRTQRSERPWVLSDNVYKTRQTSLYCPRKALQKVSLIRVGSSAEEYRRRH
jgi:hypothetical protein